MLRYLGGMQRWRLMLVTVVLSIPAISIFVKFLFYPVWSGHYQGFGGDHAFPPHAGFFYLDRPDIAKTIEGMIDRKALIVHASYPDIGQQINPVTTAQFVLSVLGPNRSTQGDQLARLNLDYMLKVHGQPFGEAIYYPYYFDWPRHGQVAPWFSSMAQGQMASAFIRGWLAFSESLYLDAAYRSLLPLIIQDSRLVRQLDHGVWLQEYPDDVCQVLDGKLAAIAGLWDAYREVTKDEQRSAIEGILALALDGLKENIHQFYSPIGHYYDECGRVPTGSYYKANIEWINYLLSYDPGLDVIKTRLVAPRLVGPEIVALRLLDLWNKARLLALPRLQSRVE